MKSCIVVLSGGQDSTTCLFYAMQHFDEIHAVTFNYGQRHDIEIQAAVQVAKLANVASHEIIDMGPILQGTSPLVDHSRDVGNYEGAEALPGGLEDTFVPGRNILFLTIAANRAYVKNATAVITGVCEEDFGGYYDCRQDFITAMAEALSEGLYGGPVGLEIITPLMTLTKKQSVELAQSLDGCMDALAFSHTCYEGKYPPAPHNHASILRAKGFAEAGAADPLILRAKAENLLPADYPDSGLVEGTAYAMKETDGAS